MYLMPGISTIFNTPVAILSTIPRRTSYAGIKIFNSLPCRITSLRSEEAKFISELRKYLNTYCFYSVEKFMK